MTSGTWVISKADTCQGLLWPGGLTGYIKGPLCGIKGDLLAEMKYLFHNCVFIIVQLPETKICCFLVPQTSYRFALPCFYSSPELTNQTVACLWAVCVLSVHRRRGWDRKYSVGLLQYLTTHTVFVNTLGDLCLPVQSVFIQPRTSHSIITNSSLLKKNTLLHFLCFRGLCMRCSSR